MILAAFWLWYLMCLPVYLRPVRLTCTPLCAFADASWAMRYSTSGWTVNWQGATISWGSRKQDCVALSSCEAEIVAASEASKEAISLSGLASELGLHDDSPIDLSMDNQSGIHVSYNPEHHGRMKHVERRHFFVREKVEPADVVLDLSRLEVSPRFFGSSCACGAS